MNPADVAAPRQSPITPHPVPTQFQVGAAKGPEGDLTVLQVLTPTGFAVYFLNRNAAIDLANMLKKQAKESSSLVIASAADVPPAANVGV